jgi:hypothetical protein
MTDPSPTAIATRRFLPSARQAIWLIGIGLVALGYALYLRYWVIENVPVGLACDAGAQTFVCLSRKVALAFDEHSVYGWVAAGAAVLTFVRPTVVWFAIALAASGLGVVLHNAGLAGFAVALLLLSLARPAPVPE